MNNRLIKILRSILYHIFDFVKQLKTPLIIILIIELFKQIPLLSNFYNNFLYPYINLYIYNITSIVPFSVYDVILLSFIIYLIICIIYIILSKYKKRYAVILTKSILWCYISFYSLWGINYFSDSISQKNGFTNNQIEVDDFKLFLDEYTENINKYYTADFIISEKDLPAKLSPIIKNKAKELSISNNLNELNTKYSLISQIYASMGIRGYYSPFTSESQISALSLDVEKPALMAHELAHLLGITSEAEANFFSYLATTSSNENEIVYSGYFFIFPYVIRDAKKILDKDDYNIFISKINPEIFTQYDYKISNWQKYYNNSIGEIQSFFYNLYLRNNNIPDGQRNYGEVIRIILNYNKH